MQRAATDPATGSRSRRRRRTVAYSKHTAWLGAGAARPSLLTALSSSLGMLLLLLLLLASSAAAANNNNNYYYNNDNLDGKLPLDGGAASGDGNATSSGAPAPAQAPPDQSAMDESWDGGVLFVLCVDLVVVAVAFAAFVYLRRDQSVRLVLADLDALRASAAAAETSAPSSMLDSPDHTPPSSLPNHGSVTSGAAPPLASSAAQAPVGAGSSASSSASAAAAAASSSGSSGLFGWLWRSSSSSSNGATTPLLGAEKKRPRRQRGSALIEVGTGDGDRGRWASLVERFGDASASGTDATDTDLDDPLASTAASDHHHYGDDDEPPGGGSTSGRNYNTMASPSWASAHSSHHYDDGALVIAAASGSNWTRSYLRWISSVLSMSHDELINSCGTEGHLYLTTQTMIIVTLLVLSVPALLVLLPLNVMLGENSAWVTGFGKTTALHLGIGNRVLWVHCMFATLISGIAVFLAVKLTWLMDAHEDRTLERIAGLDAVVYRNQYQQWTHNEEVSNFEGSKNPRKQELPPGIQVSGFAAKITGFARDTFDEQALMRYLSAVYSNDDIFQVFIVLDLLPLYQLELQLSEVEEKISHFAAFQRENNGTAAKLRTTTRRGLWWHSEVVDALQHFQALREDIKARIVEARQRPRKHTGVAFVVFRTSFACRRFIEDAAAGNLPQSTPGALGLGVPKWTVEAAPDPAEIEWQSIGIGRIEHGFRTIGINLLTFLCVLLICVPFTVFGGLYRFSPAVSGAIGALVAGLDHVPILQHILVDYIPSFMLLVIVYILPYTISYLVQYEGFHTKIVIERAAMRRVFWHLLVAILVVPSLTLILMEVVIEARLGGLRQLWDSGGLFSDGVVAIKFMVQAALLGNMADLLRIPGQLAQRWKKRSALTRREFELAEKVEPFPYFYEWPYMLGLLTLILSFSIVTPLILPFGLLFFAFKHFVDKHNLVFIHPKPTPIRRHGRARVAIAFLMASACIPQALMFFFFAIDMKIIGPAFWCLGLFLITEMLGLWFVYRYLQQNRSRFPFAFNQPHFDINILRDVYLHPCLKLEKELHMAQARQTAAAAAAAATTATADSSTSSNASASMPPQAVGQWGTATGDGVPSNLAGLSSHSHYQQLPGAPSPVAGPAVSFGAYHVMGAGGVPAAASASAPSPSLFPTGRRNQDKKRSHVRMQSQDYREWSSTQTVRGPSARLSQQLSFDGLNDLP